MLCAKVLKKELNYLASKRWEKVGRQELRPTPYIQEIDPRWLNEQIYFLYFYNSLAEL
jgi:hypothetical protein